MGGDRAVTKGLRVLPLEPGAVPCHRKWWRCGRGCGRGHGTAHEGTLPAALTRTREWECEQVHHGICTSFHLDNRKYRQDSSVRREFLFLALIY